MFLLYLLFLPLVLLMMYYLGFMISDRRKMWKEDSTKNIIFRFLLGFVIVGVLALIALLLYNTFRIRY